MTVIAGLATFPREMTTELYPAGNFMGILYRLDGASTISLHGYHVPSR